MTTILDARVDERRKLESARGGCGIIPIKNSRHSQLVTNIMQQKQIKSMQDKF